jgi:hypothetical protein
MLSSKHTLMASSSLLTSRRPSSVVDQDVEAYSLQLGVAGRGTRLSDCDSLLWQLAADGFGARGGIGRNGADGTGGLASLRGDCDSGVSAYWRELASIFASDVLLLATMSSTRGSMRNQKP